MNANANTADASNSSNRNTRVKLEKHSTASTFASAETFMAMLANISSNNNSNNNNTFTPSPSLPALNSPCESSPELGLFDEHAFAVGRSSALDFDSLSTFGQRFAPSEASSAPFMQLPPVPTHHILSYGLAPFKFSMSSNGYNPANSSSSPKGQLDSVLDSTLMPFGTPSAPALMGVAAALSPIFGSAVAINSAASLAGDGSQSLTSYSSSSNSSNANAIPTVTDFMSVFAFGTPFGASMDVVSALSNNFGSAQASNSVFSSKAFDGFSSPRISSLDSVNWLDTLVMPSFPKSQPIFSGSSPTPAIVSVSSKPPSLSSTTPKGNRETAVSSVYLSKIVGNKQTIEHPCSCKSCGIPVATMVLRGSTQSFSDGYILEVSCDNCLISSVSSPINELNLTVVQSRKRARKVNEDGKAVHCDVCQLHIGSGGVQIVKSESDEQNKRLCSGKSVSTCKSEKFSVEVVCADCRDTYGFCTECGGGGKYRTGKYRPFELFQDGRRTCSLPHYRLGETKTSHTVSQVSDSYCASLLDAKAIFVESFISQFAVPKNLSGSSANFSCVGAIRESAETSWAAEEFRIAESVLPQYVAFASIPKSSRKKSRSAASDYAEVQMAFFTAEHMQSVGVLEIKQNASKVTASQSAGLIVDMIRNAVCVFPTGSVTHILVNGVTITPAQREKLGAVKVESFLLSSPVTPASMYMKERCVSVLKAGGEMFVVSTQGSQTSLSHA
ncbi:hypothetical protein HK100_012019 [Physocladia obscura]|uniref:Uncharacterized protein n=1 Tax=Physocladia obscura TaxID=109957 RepID=A0AAD5XHX6_9FUNG|nr:hypothetical protein HK100_012019 [Physocladia obscura]